MRKILTALMTLVSATLLAQVGEYRSDFAIGVNGGYIMSNIAFVPKVNQALHTGLTGGLSMRYVCEKYFNTICSVHAEVNYSQIGWKEDILDVYDEPVINQVTGLPEEYSRTMNYIQVPVFAHLAWGKERKGLQFFFQAGPQLGFNLSESTKTNFSISDRNSTDRVNNVVAQDTMAIENKFDYGIAAGVGMEFSHPKIGHILLEGRYYYGLGNIYGDTKRDYFARSNFGNIVVKMSYLFDIVRTRQMKNKKSGNI